MRAVALTFTAILTIAFSLPALERQPSIKLPWKESGLSEREAAAHLLNRFAYGPRPGEVEAVVKMGLDRWLERQLAADLPDRELERRLDRLPALEMSASEIARTYPRPGMLLAEASRAGAIPEKTEDKKERRGAVMEWAEAQGYRSQRELAGQLMAQKLWRAVESENQLAEVMTDFWFNHFNVSMTDNQSRGYLLSYERDAIRPNALGEVRDLLGATARHPAMLLYLDNARSNARRGLNENYARELLELHTLGVDGGYTQQDVIEVARAFTGWTVQPREGSFVFRPAGHDRGAKTVLGKKLPAGRRFEDGMEDGQAVLDLLAVHPSTAKHLATKLAVRFVSDKPSPALVDRLAAVYLKSGGQVRPVLRAIAESPDFWKSVGDKIKSPFELAASALRGLDADVRDPRETLRRIADMGQKLYAYQAPTGYPDRAEAWVNTGSLVSRMTFGLDLAAGKVRGVDFTLPREETLRAYAERLLPGRDLKPALALIEPNVKGTEPEQVVGVILGSPEFQRR